MHLLIDLSSGLITGNHNPKSSKEIAKILLDDKDFNPNILDKYGNSPLHLTINNDTNNFPEIAKLLINHEKTNVNIKNPHGQTPIHIASMSDSTLPILKYLCKHPEVDIYAKDSDGNTALDYARYYYSEKVEEFLIEDGRIDAI